jgi:hypothetical protein
MPRYRPENMAKTDYEDKKGRAREKAMAEARGRRGEGEGKGRAVNHDVRTRLG